MKTIYLDEDFKCHCSADNATMEFQTDFFDGKCQSFIEGYRFIPDGKSWTGENGKVFVGKMIAPWKPYDELDATQREYEQEQLADMQAALELLGVTVDG